MSSRRCWSRWSCCGCSTFRGRSSISFYTEQLLTVCLGLTLALAFIAGERASRPPIDSGGAIATLFIVAYIVFR